MGIVSRGDFHDTGAELHVYMFVRNDGHFDWAEEAHDFQGLTDVFLVAFVFWVDGESGVAEFGFRADGADGERAVFHIDERVVFLFVIYFQFGKRGAAVGTVVDDVVVAIDFAF